MNQPNEALSVSELTDMIKRTLEGDPRFLSIVLHGEISNFKVYSSGHAYFSLKDKNAVISAVMWASYVHGLDFLPKDGDEVLVHGRMNVYPPRGSYSLSIDRMERYGQGEALLKLRQLAEKLQKEGLFDPERKRPLKKYPEHIGVIAGRGSAGLRDIEVNLLRRYPIVKLHVFPSLVQGQEAPKALLEAFYKAQELPLDTLIIARGGGSSEDLGAFNDEALVRAVATSKCPVIAAVGHEVDVTLIDLVADMRVSTPTAAAVAAVPLIDDIRYELDEDLETMNVSINRKIRNLQDNLKMLSNRSFFLHPETIYQEKKTRLEEQGKRLSMIISHLLETKRTNLSNLSGRLEAIHPRNVLNRGYSMVEDKKGHVVTSTSQLQVGDQLKVRMKDGAVITSVQGKE